MTTEEYDDELINQKDLKKFALGNTILFFGCMVYPLGEGLFSIFTYFGILGHIGRTVKIHCLVNQGDKIAVSYSA